MLRKLLFFTVSLLLGLFVVMQYHGYNEVKKSFSRTKQSNLSEEVVVLARSNVNLEGEITDLTKQLADYQKQAEAARVLRENIEKYQKISGEVETKGSGVVFEINAPLNAIFCIDTINDLFNAGAEAVAVNDQRVTLDNGGFIDSSDKVSFGRKILEKPFVFKAIGDGSILEKAIKQPGGILQRLQGIYGQDLSYNITKQEITIPKVYPLTNS